MESSKIAAKAPIIFGNIDEIEKFHSETFLPELENCNKRYLATTITKYFIQTQYLPETFSCRPDLLAETFLDNSQQMVRLYCRCSNLQSYDTKTYFKLELFSLSAVHVSDSSTAVVYASSVEEYK